MKIKTKLINRRGKISSKVMFMRTESYDVFIIHLELFMESGF